MSLPEDVLGEKAAGLPRAEAAWMSPMLATLTHNHFSSPDWIFERKLDGERCLVVRKDGKVRLYSRNRKELNRTYPELVDALQAMHTHGTPDFVADGEVVAFSGQVTSFKRLQRRMQVKDPEEARSSSVAVYLYLFDLPVCDGADLTSLPLVDRKKVLKAMLEYEDPVRYTAHRNREGETYHQEACRKRWEGIIAKRRDSAYAGKRSRDWLKFKCGRRQEFVICGFTEPEGERVGFGALLLGYYDGDSMRYAGQVGTGFDNEFLRSFRETLEDIERADPPVESGQLPSKGVHWVEPEYVGEVGFTEWTGKGRLRHPRFLGLRRDKAPRQVVREEA